MALTREQQEILEFERRWPRYGNEKVRAVREWFDLSTSEYDKLLGAVLELPSAKEYDEALVTSLRRWRAGERWFHERQQGSAAP